MDAVDDVFNRVDLVGPHHEQLLLVGDEHHVAADHVAEGALGQEVLGKAVEMGDLLVVPVGVLIDGKEEFLRIEGEVPEIVVNKVVGVRPVADDEELHEGQQRIRIAVAEVLFVVDNLLHGPARADFEGFEFDLAAGDTIDEQDHIKTLKAIAGVDPQLAHDLEVVFAPILDIDQSEVQRGAVVPLEIVDLAEYLGSFINVWRGDLVQQAGEFAVGELDCIEPLEFLPEIGLQ